MRKIPLVGFFLFAASLCFAAGISPEAQERIYSSTERQFDITCKKNKAATEITRCIVRCVSETQIKLTVFTLIVTGDAYLNKQLNDRDLLPYTVLVANDEEYGKIADEIGNALDLLKKARAAKIPAKTERVVATYKSDAQRTCSVKLEKNKIIDELLIKISVPDTIVFGAVNLLDERSCKAFKDYVGKSNTIRMDVQKQFAAALAEQEAARAAQEALDKIH